MKKILIVFVMILAGLSCTKNYLDKKPLDTAAVSTLFSSADGLKLAVNGIYDVFQSNIWGGSLYYLNPHFDAISEDATFCCAWEGSYSVLADGNLNAASGGIVDYTWKFGYQGIGRANAVLENIDNPKIVLADSIKIKFKAETRFLRGLIYFNLVTSYGGVPLILKPVEISNAKLARNTKDDVIKAILEDLDFSIANLSTAPFNNENGRPTKQAALGIETRLYLYQGRWAEAAATAQKIIDLEATGAVGLSNNYVSLFDGTNKTDKEVLFAIQSKGASASSPDVGEGNILSTCYGLKATEFGGGWASLSYEEPMFDAFYMKDGKPVTTSPLYDATKPYENRDQRFYWSFFVPGHASWNSKPYTPDNYAGAYAELPINTRKWVASTDPNYGLAGDANFIVVRYADVLLMYAEAKNETTGPDASVYSALNKIRQRAAMPEVTPGLSAADMREVIRHERKVELSQEGFRYFDLVRWGIAKQKINSNSRQKRNWHEYNSLLPIPQSEMNANPNLVQNPGYPQ